MREPKRICDMQALKERFRELLVEILDEMRGMGWDPIVIETVRNQERQDYLYSLGRRGRKGERVVTWERHSSHKEGNAGDVISRTRGYDAPEFFNRLEHVAAKHHCRTLKNDRCHVEWDGS